MNKKVFFSSKDIKLSSPNSLTQERIKKLLIYTIQQYKIHTISLETLIQLVKMILTSKNIVLSDNLKSILEEIKTLTFVESVLTDILDDLKQR